MANQPQSFSQWVAQNQGAFPSVKTPVSKVDVSSIANATNGQSSQKKAGNQQDFLSWLTDILTRPLSGVTNTVQSAVNRSVDAQQAFNKGDVAGGLGQLGGGLAGAAGGDFLAGLLSSDPNLHRTTSDVIEQSTDKIAPMFDPNYQDVTDNVNPVVKGIAGFAGDVALDPLTWIPGAQIAKVGKFGLDAAKIGLDAVKGSKAAETLGTVSKALRGVPEAPEDAAKVVDDLTLPSELSDAEMTAAKPLDNPFTNQPISMPKKVVADEASAEGPAIPLSIADQIKASPRVKAMTGILDELSKVPKTKAPTAAVDAVPSAPLQPGQWWAEYKKLAGASPAHKSTVRVKPLGNAPREASFSEIDNMVSKGNDDAKRALIQMYTTYRQAWDVAAKRGKPFPVDALSRPVTKPAEELAKPDAPQVTILNQLGRYQQFSQENREKVEQAFGVGLADQLDRLAAGGNPAKFDRIMQRINDVLRPQSDLSDFAYTREDAPTLKRLFKALNIDPIATNTARRQAESNVGKQAVGDPSIFEKMKDPNLGAAPQVDRDVADTLPQYVKQDFEELSSYKYETATGTLRTDDGIGTGLGRNERALNTHSQYTWGSKLMKTVQDRLYRGQGLKGQALASQKMIEYMAARLKGEALLDQHGFPLYLDFAGTKLPLSAGQYLEVLVRDNPDLMRKVFFNPETSVPETKLSDAVFQAVKNNATADEIAATLKSVARRNSEDRIDVPNPLAGEGNRRYGFIPKTMRNGKPQDGDGYRWVENKVGGKLRGWFKVWDGDYLTAQTTDAIMHARDELGQIASENASSYSARLMEETYDLTDEQIQSLTQLVNDPEQLGTALRTLGAVPSRIAKSAFDGGAMKTSSKAATVLTETAAPEGAIEGATTAHKLSDSAVATAKKEAKSGKKPKEQAIAVAEAGKATAQKEFEERAAQADEVAAQVEDAAFDPSGDTRDWAVPSAAYRSVKAGIAGALDPANRFFNSRAGLENLWATMNNAGALHGNWIGVRHDAMNAINRQYGGFVAGTQTPVIRQAFQDLQLGVTSSNPVVAGARAELGKLVGELFDLSGKEPVLGNTFFRSNVGLDKLNDQMAFNGISQQFDVSAAATAAKANGTDLITEAAHQWKSWQIDDPLDFISRVDTAAMRLFTDHAVGQSFVRQGKTLGWIVDKPTPGYSRLLKTDGSTVAAALPKNAYVQNEMLTELKHLDEVMYASRQIDGTLGQYIQRYFDPMQAAWKKGITIYRPGHHIRNLVGDSSATFVAEGVKGLKKSVANTFKVMQLRNDYEGVDLVRALNELGETSLTGTGDVLSAGKFGQLTAKDLYDAAERNGLFRNARVIEDYAYGGEQGTFAKVMDKLSLNGTRVEHAAASLSEYREHTSRLQHFLQIIEKAQDGRSIETFYKTERPKDLNELFAKAADRVKRYHPDSSMLSPAELKYMRRLIPFYSWFRGILPAIVESTVMHPGRVSVFPKASYNLAVASGVDPLSLSDPFPTDQLFPSFLTDQMTGPQFKVGGQYFSINPGIAHLDVLNQFATDPVRGVAGMVTPLLRVPAELLSGGSWGTGAGIKDNSDYIDSSLPGVGYLANFTGVSPTGSVLSLLQGKGLDPQAQVAAGNKTGVDQALSIANYLTGLGLANQSRPNYINYAEIQKRNAAVPQTGTGF